MANYDVEREEMRKAERIASMFKFTKMEKKKSFMPSYDVKGEFEDGYVKSFDNSLPYLDGRIREALVFPGRIKDRSRRFSETKTCDGSYLSKPVGQEFDIVDEIMKKYMKSPERGIQRPRRNSFGISIMVPKESKYL